MKIYGLKDIHRSEHLRERIHKFVQDKKANVIFTNHDPSS